jgi:type I restriction enzyme S subunit
VRSLADEVPFDIPDSWEWVRLIAICEYIQRGKSPKYSPIKKYPVVAQKCNQWSGFSIEKAQFIEPDSLSSYGPERLLQDNDLIWNSTGLGTLGRMAIYKTAANPYELAVADSHVTVIRPLKQFVLPEYLYYYFANPTVQSVIEDQADGTTKQKELATATIKAYLTPIPPLKEQCRILAKLSEVLPVVNSYGAVYDETAAMQKAFPERLKKSILQEVVQGKLVPQDPSDEPAEALLERIRAEKQRLIKEGKIKKDKHESVIFRRDNSHYEKLDGVERCIDDELPFEIPENWCWCKIGTVFTLQAGKNIQAAEIHENPFAESYPCYGGNGIRGYVASSNRTGDYPIIGRQGALCGNINRATGEFYATEHAVCVETYSQISVAWACLFLTALNLNQYATATAQPGLAVANINEVYIPLPPLAEQRRIVHRIEELLPLVKGL